MAHPDYPRYVHLTYIDGLLGECWECELQPPEIHTSVWCTWTQATGLQHLLNRANDNSLSVEEHHDMATFVYVEFIHSKQNLGYGPGSGDEKPVNDNESVIWDSDSETDMGWSSEDEGEVPVIEVAQEPALIDWGGFRQIATGLPVHFA